MDDQLARLCGSNIARDCILQARGSRGPQALDAYLEALRRRCGRGRDHTLVLVLDQLDRCARAGRLASPAELLDFADQLQRDGPLATDARALLDGLRDAAHENPDPPPTAAST